MEMDNIKIVIINTATSAPRSQIEYYYRVIKTQHTRNLSDPLLFLLPPVLTEDKVPVLTLLLTRVMDRLYITADHLTPRETGPGRLEEKREMCCEMDINISTG